VTAYERILKAVRHERADRLPIDYRATPEAHAKLKTYLAIEDDEALLRRLGCDFRRVEGRFVGPDDMVGAPGVTAQGKDFLGVVWEPVKNEFGAYNEIAFHPLGHVTTVREVDEYSCLATGFKWNRSWWFCERPVAHHAASFIIRSNRSFAALAQLCHLGIWVATPCS